MKLARLRSNRGLTLPEVAVSIGIMAFIFGAMAYMIFVTGRSTFQVREQSVSQQQAAAAAERITNTLRNASGFRPHGADTMLTSVTKVLYDIPDNSEATGFKTGIVAFVEATNPNSSDGVIKIFEDIDDFDLDEKAPWEFDGVQDFKIGFNSPSWITISAKYNYRGFRMTEIDTDNNGVHDFRLAGEFITDVIAKNHHPGESAHYAETTSTLFQL